MWRQLLHGNRAIAWYALLAFVLPVLTLLILGLALLWQENLLIPVSIIWLTITLTAYALYRFWPDTANTQPVQIENIENLDNNSHALPQRLKPRDDWAKHETDIWQNKLLAIEDALQSVPTWEQMPEIGLELVAGVASDYNPAGPGSMVGMQWLKAKQGDDTNKYQFSFTLPQALLVVSETTIRYRQVLLQYLPFADSVKVSSIMQVYDNRSHIVQSANWINTIRRAARLTNPLAALTAELRDQFTNRIFTNLSNKVQNDLKRLLLQELVQVAMDLYSGRLSVSESELAHYESNTASADRLRKAKPAEPLRIVLIGQTSAGKSSLVNALVNELQAETDILPTTNTTTVHELSLTKPQTNHDEEVNGAVLRLVDTVGITETTASTPDCIDEACQADLLVWVLRATQPARNPESLALAALTSAIQQSPGRRMPPMLMVLTHIDLLKPKASWNPPYDLRSDDPKAMSINAAIESCLNQIGLEKDTPCIPVSLKEPTTAYNIDAFGAQLMLMHDDAVQAQFNRRRVELSEQQPTFGERWAQASNLGKVTGKVIKRSLLGD